MSMVYKLNGMPSPPGATLNGDGWYGCKPSVKGTVPVPSGLPCKVWVAVGLGLTKTPVELTWFWRTSGP